MSRPNTPIYKTLNWPAYNKALKRRRSLTIWFDPDMARAAQPTPADTSGLMSILHGVAGPLEGPPMHVHATEDEALIVLGGAIDFDLKGTPFRCGPMEAAFVARGVPHRFRTGPKGATCVAVMTPGGFGGYFEEPADVAFELPCDIAAVAACAARASPTPAWRRGADMRDIAFVFRLAAVLCVTGGMVWGIQMAFTETTLWPRRMPTSISSAGGRWHCSACITG